MIWIAGALAHTPVLHDVHAHLDWCGFVNGRVENNGLLFEPGDVALFQPGTYTGPCDFEALPTTEAGEVSILQSADPDDPPVFVSDGSSPWILRVRGTSFFLVGLRFEPVPDGVTAILLEDAHDGWVRYPVLPRVDGTGIAVRGACSDLDLLNLRIEGGHGIGVDIDCTGDVALGESWITLDRAVDLQSTSAHLFDNTFDGATPLQLQADTLLERNLIVGASTAVAFSGEALLMRGNIVSADAVGSFGPGASIRILGNTFLATLDAPTDAVVAANALLAPETSAENVSCDGSCFAAPDALDLFPPAGSPLRDLASLPAEIGLDFCEKERATPVAGALSVDQEPVGPIPVGFKSDLPCTFAVLPQRETPPGLEDAAASRGCSVAPVSSFALFTLPLFLRTRRRGHRCS